MSRCLTEHRSHSTRPHANHAKCSLRFHLDAPFVLRLDQEGCHATLVIIKALPWVQSPVEYLAFKFCASYKLKQTSCQFKEVVTLRKILSFCHLHNHHSPRKSTCIDEDPWYRMHSKANSLDNQSAMSKDRNGRRELGRQIRVQNSSACGQS